MWMGNSGNKIDVHRIIKAVVIIGTRSDGG